MNKKKIDDKGELDFGDLESEESPTIQDASQKPSGLVEETKPDYELGKWNGIEQFKCAHCSFDTLIENEMSEHLFWVHSIIIDIIEK